ncbi:MAG: hypothetical protein ACI8PZ_006146 [Myxococcota bacterium]
MFGGLLLVAGCEDGGKEEDTADPEAGRPPSGELPAGEVEEGALDLSSCEPDMLPTRRRFAQTAYFHVETPFVPPGGTHALTSGVLLVGGRSLGGAALDDMWLLDLTNATRRPSDKQPFCPWIPIHPGGTPGLDGGVYGGTIVHVQDGDPLGAFALIGGWVERPSGLHYASDSIVDVSLADLDLGFAETYQRLPAQEWSFVEIGDPTCTEPTYDYMCVLCDSDDDGIPFDCECDAPWFLPFDPCTGAPSDGVSWCEGEHDADYFVGCAADPWCSGDQIAHDFRPDGSRRGWNVRTVGAPGLAFFGAAHDPVGQVVRLVGGSTGCAGGVCADWDDLHTADHSGLPGNDRMAAARGVIEVTLDPNHPDGLYAARLLTPEVGNRAFADDAGWHSDASIGLDRVAAAKAGIRWTPGVGLSGESNASAVLGGTHWQRIVDSARYAAFGDEVPGRCGPIPVPLFPGGWTPLAHPPLLATADSARVFPARFLRTIDGGASLASEGIVFDDGAFAVAATAIDPAHVFVSGGLGWEDATHAQYLIRYPLDAPPKDDDDPVLAPPPIVEAWRPPDTDLPTFGGSGAYDYVAQQGVLIGGENSDTVRLVSHDLRPWYEDWTPMGAEYELAWEDCDPDDGSAALDAGRWHLSYAMEVVVPGEGADGVPDTPDDLLTSGVARSIELTMPTPLFEQWTGVRAATPCGDLEPAPQLTMDLGAGPVPITRLLDAHTAVEEGGVPMLTAFTVRLPQPVAVGQTLTLRLDGVLEATTEDNRNLLPRDRPGTAMFVQLDPGECNADPDAHTAFATHRLPLSYAEGPPSLQRVRVVHPVGGSMVLAPRLTACAPWSLVVDAVAVQAGVTTETCWQPPALVDPNEVAVVVHPSAEKVADIQSEPPSLSKYIAVYTDTCLFNALGPSDLDFLTQDLQELRNHLGPVPLDDIALVFTRSPPGGALGVTAGGVSVVQEVEDLLGNPVDWRATAYHELAHTWVGTWLRFPAGEPGDWLQEAIPTLLAAMRYAEVDVNPNRLFMGLNHVVQAELAGDGELAELEDLRRNRDHAGYLVGPYTLAQAIHASPVARGDASAFILALVEFHYYEAGPYPVFDNDEFVRWLVDGQLMPTFHSEWVQEGRVGTPLLAVSGVTRTADGVEITVEQRQDRLETERAQPTFTTVPFHLVCEPTAIGDLPPGCSAAIDSASAPTVDDPLIHYGSALPITIETSQDVRFAVLGPHFLLPGLERPSADYNGIPYYGIQGAEAIPVTVEGVDIAPMASPWLVSCGSPRGPLCDLAVDSDGDGWEVLLGRYGGDCDDTEEEVHPTRATPGPWHDASDPDCDGWPYGGWYP